MAAFEIDTSELRKLAADLGKMPEKARPQVEKVMLRGALNIRDGVREEFRKSKHFRRVGSSVGADRVGGYREIAYEIGPEVGRGAGSLGGIAVEGGANGGGGSVDFEWPLEDEAPALEEYIAEALGDAL